MNYKVLVAPEEGVIFFVLFFSLLSSFRGEIILKAIPEYSSSSKDSKNV